MSSIKENIEIVNARILKACQRAGRNTDEVRLMAVSKTRPLEDVIEAYNCGLRLFGENRVIEAVDKFSGVNKDAEVHLIGHLQRNKTSKAVGLFKCIESIDKYETALEIDKKCAASGKVMEIYLEYNTSGEMNKSGFRNEKDFFESIDRILELGNVQIKGLMTMAPFTDDEKLIRKSFSSLRNIHDKIISKYSEISLDVLSMGMTNDFEVAIEEGSTLLRLGTILFGNR